MIKKEKKDQYTTKYIENLINTVQLLDHPGVIKIFEVYDSPNCYTIITTNKSLTRRWAYE